jgi:hypothetical protein
MPGGSGPVELAMLPRLADGAFRAFVRFPAGWSRPGPGHYPVAEEVLLLEGDLELSGRAFSPGAHAWLPAGWLRTGMRTRAGCLVFAWFAKAPRWIPGESMAVASDAPPHETRMVDGQLVRILAAGRETLRMGDRSWSFRGRV